MMVVLRIWGIVFEVERIEEKNSVCVCESLFKKLKIIKMGHNI